MDSILGILARRADSDDARAEYHLRRAFWLLNTGRSAAAMQQADSMPLPPNERSVMRLFAATYWDADSAVGAAAASELIAVTAGALPDSAAQRRRHLTATCALEQWRLHRGDASGVARALARLRQATEPRDHPRIVRSARLCAMVLEAAAATLTRRPDAGELV